MAKGEGGVLGTVLVVGIVAAAAALAVNATYDWSRDRIAANVRARVAARLSSVLDPSLKGSDLETVPLRLDDPLLGTDVPVDAWVMRSAGRPVAAVLSVVAPHGYNAPIHLLVGIAADGALTGVRAVSHRETPGLGDQIDATKSDWITQFVGKRTTEPSIELWAVDRDDGAFDSITGATVTSRAVVAAVKNALLYFEQHQVELLDAAAAATPNATSD